MACEPRTWFIIELGTCICLSLLRVISSCLPGLSSLLLSLNVWRSLSVSFLPVMPWGEVARERKEVIGFSHFSQQSSSLFLCLEQWVFPGSFLCSAVCSFRAGTGLRPRLGEINKGRWKVFSLTFPGAFALVPDQEGALVSVFADHAYYTVMLIWPTLVSKPGNKEDKTNRMVITILFVVLPCSPQSPCCYLIVRGLLLFVFCAVFSCNWWEGDVRTKSQIVPFLNKNKHD